MVGGSSRGSTLTIGNSTLSNNSATYGGGLFHNAGSGTITGSTFSANGATQSGGAIAISTGSETITGSTLTGNSAGSNGGGIANHQGNLALIDSTLTGNTAVYGGGIHNASTLTAVSSTIASNRATSAGGGLYLEAGVATVRDTIVAGNLAGASPSTTPDDVRGPLAAAVSVFNLIGSGSGMTGITNGSGATGSAPPRRRSIRSLARWASTAARRKPCRFAWAARRSTRAAVRPRSTRRATRWPPTSGASPGSPVLLPTLVLSRSRASW